MPAGGLNASVNDMSRFIRMILAEGELDGQRIIKPETVRETAPDSDVAQSPDHGNGQGWNETEYR
jgi:CubicO group peptidase (beta-lactamase class C family)